MLFCIFRRDGAAGSSEVQIDVDGEKDAVGGGLRRLGVKVSK